MSLDGPDGINGVKEEKGVIIATEPM